ncbi:MAG: site-2 protease family protein [Candidatus Liptonbacteria bacterium]|nr:site-2 protease family protein [Candidatus Liptonbacteria bacterium]
MSADILVPLFQFVVLIFSVMLHEVSHGAVALALGDDTAKREGRLTLNPLKHVDPTGSVLVPLLLYVATQGRLVFGWARPVPYDPRFLKNPKAAEGIIAAAGPGCNLLVAVIFAGILGILRFAGSAPPQLEVFISAIIFINILLGVFNAVPIPPLDGSKILFSLLPSSAAAHRARETLERYGLPILLVFIIFGMPLIVPVVEGLFRFLVMDVSKGLV